MSDSAVPCIAPYRPTTVNTQGATVVLTVGRGYNMQTFDVPAVLLCKGSEYFQERLAHRDTNMADRPLTFPHEDPTLFKVFLEFLSTGILRHNNLREASPLKYFCRFLAELYAFASSFDAYPMRNAIIDAFFFRIYRKPSSLPWESVRHVYDNTSRNSSLRDLTIHIIINLGTEKRLERYEHHLPHNFLVDCLTMAAEDGTVPFHADTHDWLETKKRYLCKQYHVHDKELEQEEEGKDEDDAEDDGPEGDDKKMGSDDEGLGKGVPKYESDVHEIQEHEGPKDRLLSKG